MSALSDYAEKLLLDWMMTTGTVTRPTSWFVSLYSDATNDANGGTESAGDGYARHPLTFAAGTSPGGTTNNTNAVNFTANGSDWGAITHMGIMTAASGGERLWHGPLTTPRTINDGDTLSYAVGAINLTMA